MTNRMTKKEIRIYIDISFIHHIYCLYISYILFIYIIYT